MAAFSYSKVYSQNIFVHLGVLVPLWLIFFLATKTQKH